MNKHLIAAAATALLTLAPLVHSQGSHASAEARKLTIALANLRKNPNDPTAQQAYLQAFPKKYAVGQVIIQAAATFGAIPVQSLHRIRPPRGSELLV